MSFLDDDWLEQTILDLAGNLEPYEIGAHRVEKAIDEAIRQAVPEMARELAHDIKSRAHETLSDHRYLTTEFAARLERRWFEALDLLELVIGSLAEIGEELNDQLRRMDEPKRRYTIEVMTRIHARGTRIAREILCLLRNGYADGALARWRSLHELSAYQYFILQSGEDTAKKFLDYVGIDRFKEAEVYREHAQTLGYAPLSKDEWDQVARAKEALIKKHGSEFGKRYGWTMDILPPEERSFRGIEDAVGLAHLRPFYAMASRSIHSTPKGLVWDVGLCDEGIGENPFLAGASNYGFADPGQNCAISFLQITTALALVNPTVTGMTSIKAIGILVDETAKKLVSIQTQIDEEEKANDFADSDND